MIVENLKKYIELKGISIAAFERSIGMSNNSFRKSLNTGGNLGSDKLENILKVYSELNPVWVLTGEGDMLINSNVASKNANSNANPNANLLGNDDSLNTLHSQKIDSDSLRKRKRFDGSGATSALQKNLEESNFFTEAVSPPQNNNSNELIKYLIDRLQEQSEEIGVLKQENNSLKYQLAKIADSAPNASSVPA